MQLVAKSCEDANKHFGTEEEKSCTPNILQMLGQLQALLITPGKITHRQRSTCCWLRNWKCGPNYLKWQVPIYNENERNMREDLVRCHSLWPHGYPWRFTKFERRSARVEMPISDSEEGKCFFKLVRCFFAIVNWLLSLIVRCFKCFYTLVRRKHLKQFFRLIHI